MTDRDRLIEIMLNAPQIPCIKGGQATGKRYQTFQIIADYLLANGVIVPPCKVGDTVWILFRIEKTIESREIESIMRRRKSWTMRFTNGDCFTVWDSAEEEYFGKTVFLTKEEAEEKLREMGK